MKKSKKFKIIFMDGYDEVRDIDTQDVIFSTKIDKDLSQCVNRKTMVSEVVDNVVNIWNKHKSVEDCLFSNGTVDNYLLDEGNCTQDEREIIVEALYDYSVKKK
jgi:hypothetical protein